MKAKIAALLDAYKAADAAYNAAALAAYRGADGAAAAAAASALADYHAAYRAADDAWNEYQAALAIAGKRNHETT